MIWQRLFVALIAVAMTLLAPAVLTAHPPPGDLHQAGDHWTVWDPPTSFPEGSEIYRVREGDTLWDLADRYYGNPYLWPQLWEGNRYILDAHWIYPGDPLVVGIEIMPLEELAAAADETPMAEEAAQAVADTMFDSSTLAPVALGSEADIYCSGYIGEMDERFPYSITGTEHEHTLPTLSRKRGPGTTKLTLSVGDIIYVDGGREGGLSPGLEFTVVSAEQSIRHPDTNSVVGRFYRYRGRVRVLSVQDRAGIAEILHGCHPIRVGNALKPFEPEPVPLSRPPGLRGVNDPLASDGLTEAPAIIYSESGLVALGEDHVVYIDRGVEDDVVPGNTYTIYRVTRPGQPSLVVGELAVLSVQQRTSLARILDSRYTIHVGDRLGPSAP